MKATNMDWNLRELARVMGELNRKILDYFIKNEIDFVVQPEDRCPTGEIFDFAWLVKDQLDAIYCAERTHRRIEEESEKKKAEAERVPRAKEEEK